MGKDAAFLGFIALMSVSGAALASNDVVGVTDGGLAAQALTQRDFKAAIKRLHEKSPDAVNDAARMINLGNAYAGLGRIDSARRAYQRARFAPEQMLVLADGSESSSRTIATRAFDRLDTEKSLN